MAAPFCVNDYRSGVALTPSERSGYSRNMTRWKVWLAEEWSFVLHLADNVVLSGLSLARWNGAMETITSRNNLCSRFLFCGWVFSETFLLAGELTVGLLLVLQFSVVAHKYRRC